MKPYHIAAGFWNTTPGIIPLAEYLYLSEMTDQSLILIISLLL